MGDELAREDQLETDVVGQRGEDGLVIDQDEGGQRPPVRRVAEQIRRPSASVALPPLPKVNSRPPASEALRHERCAGALHLVRRTARASLARRRPTVGILALADMTRSATRAAVSRSSASMKG